MKINITPQTRAKINSLAKNIYTDLVEGYRFDGKCLKPIQAVSIRQSIMERITCPDQLLRLKLDYGEDGPTDRWKAHAETLLGGGVIHKDQRYSILGAGSSLKDGNLWLAADDLRDHIHRYFGSCQKALSYCGILFSGCHHGIWKLEDLKGRIVSDGEYGTADGMGFISLNLIRRLGLSYRQLQVRLF